MAVRLLAAQGRTGRRGSGGKGVVGGMGCEVGRPSHNGDESDSTATERRGYKGKAGGDSVISGSLGVLFTRF